MYHPLNNLEIEKLLSAHPATKNIYKGFLYPHDTKTPKISPPALYIVNTDYAEGPGLHWILIYYLKNKTIFSILLVYHQISIISRLLLNGAITL